MSMPRVVLVDDHGIFRSGVRSELGRQVEVVGEAEDVQPAIELISELLPDVVLLDVHLPGGGGQAVLQAVKAKHPEVKFLALSASDAPEDVIAVIRAGARVANWGKDEEADPREAPAATRVELAVARHDVQHDAALAACQIPGRDIGPIPQLFGGAMDRLPGALRDPPTVGLVEDVADRRGRHARQAGHIGVSGPRDLSRA